MVELAGRPGLLLEAPHPGAIARYGAGQDLDRDVAADAGVAGAVDFAHSPRAEESHHLVRPQPGARGQSHF